MATKPASSVESALLPQYGFGATYTFDALVEHHHFLYRVHTPKNRSTRSRAASPSPRSSSPFAHSRQATLSRQPSTLSASVASIRSNESGASDYFGPVSFVADEDDSAPGDPYFLSRKFKDDLTSPDPYQRRRTISTLSTLSGGSGAYSFIGSDNESDAESDHALQRRRGNLSRSSSVMLGHSRVRTDSIVSNRPGAKRSQSVGIGSPPAPVASPPQQGTEATESTVMTYSDLVRHLDWTTRSSSPYVTTSFSFFWCLWEAVRRYKLGVKHDVEIAVIDARKVQGRARTALEVLRGVEPDKQDRAYWKWYRFALESQDVLVFGAISGDAIYASIPLTQILPKLPSYFFVDDVPRAIADPREPDPSIDPRSPTAQTHNPLFPSTPSRPRSPHGERERDREALSTAHLLTKLAWDIGTTLKPIRKSKDTPARTPGKPAPRHTSHADFCKALSAAFARRPEADQMRDATTGAVGLAELLIEPWFRARCAEYISYPFRHDDSDDEKLAESDKMNDSVCLGLAGDGCTLEHSHDSSIQDALFEKDEETEEEAARREAAAVLSELALSLARWPAALWYAEHAETIEALVSDVVNMCVSEAARGVAGRLEWSIVLEEERQRRRTVSLTGSIRSRADTMSLSGSLLGTPKSERRGREETRDRERSRSRSPLSDSSTKHARFASDDSSSRRSSLKESPYKPRAKSPLGASPVLGPAIVIRPRSKPEKDATATEPKGEQPWSPSTPPPSPPRVSEGELKGASSPRRRSPPPPPPPRSSRRPPSPQQSIESSLASLDSVLPSPNASPSASFTSSSLLKRSIHRRAESIPGGWPGDSSPEDRAGSPVVKEQGDVFYDPSLRDQAKKRPVSWAGTGLALGALSSSLSSSTESLRAGAADSTSSSPSPSIRRGPTRSQSDSQTRETLLSEVVSSALGLGAAVVAASASPLKLDMSSSSPSSETTAPGIERPSRHHRHSSHGVEIELSPVREVEQEDEAEQQAEIQPKAEREEASESVVVEVAASGEELHKQAESVAVERIEVTRPEETQEQVAIKPDVQHSTSVEDTLELEREETKALNSLDGEQSDQPKSGSSTPRSERRLSRSGTLASIPEEDLTEWSLVEAPSPAEYQVPVETCEPTVKSTESKSGIVESEIPLPPSPKLEPTETDVTEPEVDKEISSKAGDSRKVPEITLTVDTSNAQPRDVGMVEDSEHLSPRWAESRAAESSGALSRIFVLPFNISLREPLAKTRVFLHAFLLIPVANLFRKVTPAGLPPLSSPLTPMPSPIFEDSRPPSVISRLSRFFSFFRIPLVHSCSGLFPWLQRRQRAAPEEPDLRSMETILAPPPRWDTPIPECEPYPPLDKEKRESYWDARSTSWVVSCFLAGVTAALVLASAERHRCEEHILVWNRYH